MDRQSTKEMVEADVASAVVRFHRDRYGRSPAEVTAILAGDLLVLRCRGVLTPQEERLTTTERGCQAVRAAREELFHLIEHEAHGLVTGCLGCAVLRAHMSVDPASGEQIEVYVLAENAERSLLRHDLHRLAWLVEPSES